MKFSEPVLDAFENMIDALPEWSVAHIREFVERPDTISDDDIFFEIGKIIGFVEALSAEYGRSRNSVFDELVKALEEQT